MKIKISYGYTFKKGKREDERIDASIEYDTKKAENEGISEMDNVYDGLKEWVMIKGGKL